MPLVDHHQLKQHNEGLGDVVEVVAAVMVVVEFRLGEIGDARPAVELCRVRVRVVG